MKFRPSLIVGAVVLLAASTATAQQPLTGFAALANDFVYTTLSFSPTAATQAGLHEWTDRSTGRRVLLDSLLDDFSTASLARQRAYYTRVTTRLKATPRARLDAQTQADYDLLSDATAYALFALDRERFHTRRPQLYAENLGNALFSSMALDYAEKPVRAAHLTARVAQVPRYVTTAIRNLRATNPVYTRVALEESEGVVRLIEGLGAEFVKGTPVEARYARERQRAVTALHRYQAFVRDSLGARATFDWRVGKPLFDTKWRYALRVSLSPEQMLRLAEDSLAAARREMYQLSMPLHDQWFPGHRHGGDSATVLNAIVGEVLASIGEEHAHRDSLLDEARRHSAMLQAIVRERRLLSIDTVPNLRIIETPEFMRGVYGVAGAVFAPALQPHLATFYWVTPIPTAWNSARAESRLREYNDYTLLTLSMHEGIPGHVTQGAYANRITPEWRRLLRTVYGNGPYGEGWAVYAEQVMQHDAGISAGDPVKQRLTRLKWMARIYSNAIIDVKLHTQGMPEDSAVAFIMRDAFQERPEAEAKLQRAQLDYVQLNTYFAGATEWGRLRQEVEQREGMNFDACRFHDTVLLYGPVPVPTVRRLYAAGVPPSANLPPSRCGTTSSLP